MQLLRVKLVDKIERTSDVVSFRFSSGQRPDFIPGQFLQLIFDEPNQSNKELNKYLSFSSSPTKDYIEVTKRLSSSQFSQKLRGLKAKDEVLIKAPLGSCVFKDEYKRIGFLIGGIGITPVISIIEHVIDKKLDTDIILLYSNRTEEDIAFRKELDYWQSINNKIKIIYTLTDCQPKDRECISGRINEELVRSKIDDLYERIFFIFGPPSMVEAMSKICFGLGCKKEKIKTESFIGY